MNEHNFISSPLNYTGGKTKLLPQIIPLFPNEINTFVDLFCGGCNVGINIQAKRHIYNDINSFIIDFYNFLLSVNKKEFIKQIDDIIYKYDLSNSTKYGYEIYGCESAKGLSSYNKNKYLKLRTDFNNFKNKNIEYYAMFYVLTVFAFNNQIRFNSKNEYNIPVGKRDFNDKMRVKLSDFIDKIQNQNSSFYSADFSSYIFDKNDFIYLDPPYLITTASYNENNGWTTKDEERLLDFLDTLIKQNIKFALSNVLEHKNHKNELLINWCNKHRNNIIVHHLNFNYANSNYQTSKKDTLTDEVLITNFLK